MYFTVVVGISCKAIVLSISNFINSLSDEFYGLFYLALYNEVLHRPSMAALYLKQALGTKYAQQSNDYMVSCAKVQSKLQK